MADFSKICEDIRKIEEGANSCERHFGYCFNGIQKLMTTIKEADYCSLLNHLEEVSNKIEELRINFREAKTRKLNFITRNNTRDLHENT